MAKDLEAQCKEKIMVESQQLDSIEEAYSQVEKALYKYALN